MATQVSNRGSAKAPASSAAAPARPKRPRIPAVLLKFVIAVSSVFLVLYLVVHMIGNLQIFWGQTSINEYAIWLRTLLQPVLGWEGFVWVVRIVLAFAVIGHIWAATLLALRAKRARPVKYAAGNKVKGNYTTRTMRWGGVIVLLFIVYHILDLTVGTLNPHGEHLAVYENVTADFAPSRWYVTIWYVIALLAIFFHLRHGLWSAVQTFGWNSNKREPILKAIATGFSGLLVLGFLIVPISVTFGWI
ncbi:succinate dehydrogenase cytochrome b subunit [Pseudonocardia halophobica]|uniref:Succinate dehydrogenase n=1 Tax=Pseudonocardia halophobica TaxID=29401 RepID=A0A9W6NZH1_9PSEU|nr:succinate dehydrogenase cytochrome b subunit [Pseudonocardia halophobica]GLL14831.1 succinate dehydrogenase [Pseudonocardia halophobica]